MGWGTGNWSSGFRKNHVQKAQLELGKGELGKKKQSAAPKKEKREWKQRVNDLQALHRNPPGEIYTYGLDRTGLDLQLLT
ncbi:hypothetical protein Dda_1342 [Drechslerella dactyloides]|uniref:Uncharacterized protein n=1 Tax=Drechslerella dactyloides TaxID=74499 RepID=A0AAD6J3X8_DREDA|nr:hypothetical protein Dda_1342 [Drechslerella dactyloides]